MEAKENASVKLLRRRSSTNNLEPLKIPTYDDSQPVIFNNGPETVTFNSEDEEEQVVEEGKELFENFLHEEIKRCSDVDLDLSPEEIPLRTPPGFKNPLWAKAGQELRLMADKFAKTEERQRVQQRANRMGINVTVDQFQDFLSQMFSDGITRERIVVLFYFCSDVAIQALRIGKNLFTQFLNWSLDFITERICTWVYSHGGWGKVLSSPFNSLWKLTLWGSVALVAVIVFRYFKK